MGLRDCIVMGAVAEGLKYGTRTEDLLRRCPPPLTRGCFAQQQQQHTYPRRVVWAPGGAGRGGFASLFNSPARCFRVSTHPVKQLKQYGAAYMEARVDPRGRSGGTPLLCAKPRGERTGHPAMFLSVGNVSVMHFQQVILWCGPRDDRPRAFRTGVCRLLARALPPRLIC